jgi:NADH-quinone oxidoreductase subunit E
MLGMAYIRALEVATFYFMFQLQPVGSVAHVQICGTLSCMLCGAEDLVAVCKERISPKAHELSADGKFSWEEVECLGSCSNAPMAQIGKDYYEDLTADKLRGLLDEFAAGRVPVPGPQNGRYAAEPLKGLTTLTEWESGRTKYNGSVQLAVDIGDTVKRIDGTEVPLVAPWVKDGSVAVAERPQAAQVAEEAPVILTAPREGKGDDLKLIVGVGPKLEALLQSLGFWHFDQIVAWTPAQVAWVNSRLGTFRGRIERDDWIAQARKLSGM